MKILVDRVYKIVVTHTHAFNYKTVHLRKIQKNPKKAGSMFIVYEVKA